MRELKREKYVVFFSLPSLNFSLQRAYCLTEVHLDFLVWLEDSHLPSMVGHAARLEFFYQDSWIRFRIKEVAVPT